MITAFIEQRGKHRRRRHIGEALTVEHTEQQILLGARECQRRPRPCTRHAPWADCATPSTIAVHEPAVQREGPAGALEADAHGELGDGLHHSSSLVSSTVGNPSATHSFFLGVDNNLGALELAAQTRDVAVELLDLPGGGVWFWSPSLRGERHAIGRVHLLAPAREHRGINALAAQERAECARRFAALGLGQQRALLPGGELATPRGRHDLRVGRRRDPGYPFTRPTASFRDAQGRSGGIADHRRLHYC